MPSDKAVDTKYPLRSLGIALVHQGIRWGSFFRQRALTEDFDEITGLFNDWQIHLRFRNVSQSTIQSYYLAVARRFAAYLDANGMVSNVTPIAREQVEHYWTDLFGPDSRTRSAALQRDAPLAEVIRIVPLVPVGQPRNRFETERKRRTGA